MMNTKEAMKALDLHVLSYLDESSPEWGDGFAYPLSCFEGDCITKDMAGAICRDLRNRGMVTFERGLFTEDGYTAGSGYAITKTGREYCSELWKETK